MSKSEIVRAYIGEPLLAALVVSLLVNIYGVQQNAEFMHAEARDILSLLLVLLAASIALWVGLFFITTTEFGKWLDSRRMTEPTNDAYIASTIIFLVGALLCIICAHVGPQSIKLQIFGEFMCLWSLAAVIPMLNNTRHLLRLHGLFRNTPKVVNDFRQTSQNSREQI